MASARAGDAMLDGLPASGQRLGTRLH